GADLRLALTGRRPTRDSRPERLLHGAVLLAGERRWTHVRRLQERVVPDRDGGLAKLVLPPHRLERQRQDLFQSRGVRLVAGVRHLHELKLTGHRPLQQLVEGGVARERAALARTELPAFQTDRSEDLAPRIAK